MREPLISTFCDVVKKTLGEDKVIFSSASAAGNPIRSWVRNWKPPEGITVQPTNTDVYDKLIGMVQRATKGQAIKSTTLIWMQGEEDARLGYGSRYEESFASLLGQFKNDLGIEKINFVLGRMNDYWVPSRGIVDGDMMRALQVKIAESGGMSAWINTDDLNTGVNPWGTYEIDGGHFPNPGYRVMGQRFARQACKIVEPKVQIDEALLEEGFIAEARKVKSNVALEKTITGTAPDAAHSGGKAGLSALVDGKLGTEDPNDAAWVAYPPTEKNISLVIDLAKPTEVNSVAVNLLVNHTATAHFPSKIDVLVSENGNDYQHLLSGRSNVVSFDKQAKQANLTKDFKPSPQFIFIEKKAPGVRYLKLEITPDSASNAWVYLDEIMVNPVMK